jgi:branched-chain amino acid aminotransferase
LTPTGRTISILYVTLPNAAAKIAMWVDGRLVAPGEPALAADDHALVGDGAFEAIKVIDGRPFALTRHLDRLGHSLQPLGIELDLDAVGRFAPAALELLRDRSGS